MKTLSIFKFIQCSFDAENVESEILPLRLNRAARNIRDGFSRKNDRLPPRLMNEPTPKGPPAGCKAFVSNEDFEMCLDKYYSLRGWDRNGKPKYETLLRLNLREAAEDLKSES